MKLLSLFSNSLINLYKNPILVIPPMLLLGFMNILSKLSVQINYQLNTKFALTLWLIFFSIISLLIISFFLSGLIGMSYDAIKGKAKLNRFFYYSKKFWLRNFIVILIILILYNIVQFAPTFIVFYIGKALALELKPAQFLYFLILFVGLIGIIIFMAFSSFYLIIKNISIKESIYNSILLVKKNYISVLAIVLLFFIFNSFINLIEKKIIVDLINSVFTLPYISLILTNFLLNFKLQNSTHHG